MIMCIQLKNFSILAIFIVCLLLFIRIPSSISIDPIVEPSSTIISQVDENNQNVTNDQHSTQINNNILSDSNSESNPQENLPIVEDNIRSETQSSIITEVTPTTSSSFIPELSLNEESSSTTPSVPTKINRSHINSFEEWKQQQLHAEALKKDENVNLNSLSSELPLSNINKVASISSNSQQIPSSKKGKLRKNFASASCGAKILAHNTEAQNVGSILSSSPDEYMLNPCNAKIWFVIELCESIRILNIEIANFELFSSVPKTFRVSASDRYPTKDWHRHSLGTFNASFNRTIQSFHAAESTTYLKYVKFELLDFHGHEHYCPLSVVRIHGSNVEDEIMIMEENTNNNDLKISSDIRDENENDEDDDDLTNDQQVGGIIGSAILDLAKRVFRRQTIRDTQSTTTLPILQTNSLKSECHSNVLNGSLTNESIHSWRQTDQFKQCIADFLFGFWSTFNTCTIYLSQMCLKFNHCCQCPRNPIDRILSSKSSLNFHIHRCGYYHVLTSSFICQKKQLIKHNQTNSMNNITQDFIEKHLLNETTIITDENKRISDFILSNNQSLLNLTKNFSNETDNRSMITRTNEQLSLIEIFNETTLIPDSSVSVNTTNETNSQSVTLESSSDELNIIETSTETTNINETNIAATTTTTPPSSSTLNHEVIPPLMASPWLKGMLVNTKSLPELFKIIEKLNFNLTLSNRYLQELSQHYVKKLDETQQTTDLLLKFSRAADEKLANLEEQFYKLQENYNDMSYSLIKLEARIPLIVCVIIILFIWCLSTTCRLNHLKRKFQHLRNEFDEMKKIKQMEKDDEDDDDQPIYINGETKRRSSTDSSDSNPTRSQRVPDVHLKKIIENGYDKIEPKLNGKSTILNQK